MPLADAVSSHVMESMCNDSICDDGTHVDIHIKDRCKTHKLHGSRMKLQFVMHHLYSLVVSLLCITINPLIMIYDCIVVGIGAHGSSAVVS